jgi:hypothetical protein
MQTSKYYSSPANAAQLEAKGTITLRVSSKPELPLVISGWNGKATTHHNNQFA